MLSESNYRGRVLLLLILVTLFRLGFSTYHELTEDESYYRLWAQNLDWSYYSKGPLVAWTIALGKAIAGDSVFGIRWISVMLSAATGWMIYRLGARLWDEAVGFWAFVIALTLPLFAIGSVLMTIDPLSVFFWISAAHLFLSALQTNQNRFWIFTGLAIGFGFLAKFVNAMQLLCFLLFILTDREHRSQLRRPGFYLMLLTFALCTLPVFYWNSLHGWITATHLQERGALTKSFEFRPKETWQFIYMQAVVISPLYFIGMIAASWSALHFFFRTATQNFGVRFAASLFLPIFIFYLVLSFNDSGEANWTATGLVGGILLLSHFSLTWILQSSVRAFAIKLGLIIALIQTTLLHDPYFVGLDFKNDPARRLRGWSDLAQKVNLLREPNDILIGNKYQTASILSFYLPDQPRTHIPKTTRIQNQFSFWSSYDLTPESKALLVTDSIDEVPDALKEQFQKIEKVADFFRQDRGRDLKRYQVYRLSLPISSTP